MIEYIVKSIKPRDGGEMKLPHEHVIGKRVTISGLHDGERCIIESTDGNGAILTSPIESINRIYDGEELVLLVTTANTEYRFMRCTDTV